MPPSSLHHCGCHLPGSPAASLKLCSLLPCHRAAPAQVARSPTVPVPLWVPLLPAPRLSPELQTLALVEGRWWSLTASELVCLAGTVSFVPSLLPWLPLRPCLMGKGAWVRGLGFSGASPARGQCLVGRAQGSCVGWVSRGGGRHGGTPTLMHLMLLHSWPVLEASQLGPVKGRRDEGHPTLRRQDKLEPGVPFPGS